MKTGVIILVRKILQVVLGFQLCMSLDPNSLSIWPTFRCLKHPKAGQNTQQSIHPSIHPSIHLFVHLSIHLFVHLFVCLSVCLCLSLRFQWPFLLLLVLVILPRQNWSVKFFSQKHIWRMTNIFFSNFSFTENYNLAGTFWSYNNLFVYLLNHLSYRDHQNLLFKFPSFQKTHMSSFEKWKYIKELQLFVMS